MTDTSGTEFDLIVVGGGPAGSTLATFVAMRDHKVLLLERDRFPRHQIGESLLPSTIHTICPLLGISEEIENANFVRKHGGIFRWGKNAEPWYFQFKDANSLWGPWGYAYQVRRAEFDDILLRNAAKKGVDVRQGHTVTGVIEEDGRVVGVRFTDEQGREHAARARFVADSSGNTTRISEKVGKREYSKLFRNVALYTYFKGAKRSPAPHAGSIVCEAFDEGWFWFIPISDELTSVGAVVFREHIDKIKQEPHAAMTRFIGKTRFVKDLLADAKPETEGIYGEYRVRRDWSYCNTRFTAPGVVLVGDAACFVDPVFSTGVHLATYSALLAARSINTCLDTDIPEERCFNEFEMRYRREFGNVYQFLIAFYNQHLNSRDYFEHAHGVLSADMQEEAANQAFVRLVSGVSTTGEPFHSDFQGMAKAKADAYSASKEYLTAVKIATLRGGHALTDADKVAATLDDTLGRSVRDRIASVGDFVPDDVLQLAKTVAIHAETGRPTSRQLFVDGLVPGEGELHWQEA